AIEVRRVSLGHQHRFAATGRAAHVIGMCGGPAVVSLNDLFCYNRQPPDRDEFEIEHSLLILHETSVEPASGALVTGIAGRDCEAAVERRPVAGSLPPGGFGYGTIQSAASLLQELAAPILGKRDSEPDTVRLAVSPG